MGYNWKDLYCAILATWFLLMLMVGAASAATVELVPGQSSVEVGGSLTVMVNVTPGAEEVYGAQCRVSFDPAALDAVGRSGGSLLTSDGNGSQVVRDELNSTAGYVEYGETRVDTTSGVTAHGTLLELSFDVSGDAEVGPTTISLGDVILSDSSASEISNVTLLSTVVNVTDADTGGDGNEDTGFAGGGAPRSDNVSDGRNATGSNSTSGENVSSGGEGNLSIPGKGSEGAGLGEGSNRSVAGEVVPRSSRMDWLSLPGLTGMAALVSILSALVAFRRR